MAVSPSPWIKTRELMTQSLDLGMEQIDSLYAAYERADPHVLGSLRCYAMFGWLLLASYIMNMANEMADVARPRSPLLRDVVLDLVDEVPVPVLADYVVGFHVLIMLYLSICSSISTVVSRRFWTVYGVINVIRALTISLTQLPDPSPRCDFDPASVARWPLWIISLRMLFPLGIITCGDLIFSGHSTVIVLTCLFWIRYHRYIVVGPVAYLRRVSSPVFRVALAYWILFPTCVSLYLIVSTRLHYTIDVLIAIYVAAAVVVGYERAIRTPSIRASSRILLWLEAHVDIHDRITPVRDAVNPALTPLWPPWASTTCRYPRADSHDHDHDHDHND